jgi:IclR family transcriptional regulator, mhp operon transcriptional activator
MTSGSGAIVHLTFLEEAQREVFIKMLQQSDDPAQALARDRPLLNKYIDAGRRGDYSLGHEVGNEQSVSAPLFEQGRIRAVLVMMYMSRAIKRQDVVNQFVPELKVLAGEIERLAGEETFIAEAAE